MTLMIPLEYPVTETHNLDEFHDPTIFTPDNFKIGVRINFGETFG